MSCKENGTISNETVLRCVLCKQTGHDVKSCAAYICLTDNYKNCLDVKQMDGKKSCIRGNYSNIIDSWIMALENSREGSTSSIQLEKCLIAERNALKNNDIENPEKVEENSIENHVGQIIKKYNQMEKNYLREKKLKEMAQRTLNSMKYEINTLKNTIIGMKSRNSEETKETREEDMLCVICLENIESVNKNCCSLPCGHRLHTTCMSKWIMSQKENTSCPLCRDQLFKSNSSSCSSSSNSSSSSLSSSSLSSSSLSSSSSIYSSFRSTQTVIEIENIPPADDSFVFNTSPRMNGRVIRTTTEPPLAPREIHINLDDNTDIPEPPRLVRYNIESMVTESDDEEQPSERTLDAPFTPTSGFMEYNNTYCKCCLKGKYIAYSIRCSLDGLYFRFSDIACSECETKFHWNSNIPPINNPDEVM